MKITETQLRRLIREAWPLSKRDRQDKMHAAEPGDVFRLVQNTTALPEDENGDINPGATGAERFKKGTSGLVTRTNVGSSWNTTTVLIDGQLYRCRSLPISKSIVSQHSRTPEQ